MTEYIFVFKYAENLICEANNTSVKLFLSDAFITVWTRIKFFGQLRKSPPARRWTPTNMALHKKQLPSTGTRHPAVSMARDEELSYLSSRRDKRLVRARSTVIQSDDMLQCHWLSYK